jgi:hypothetical protein
MSEKRKNQRDRILALLIAAGPIGVTNLVLNEVAFRYGGRLFELRKAGWDIETKAEGESVFRFILKGRKAAQQMRLIA